MILESDFRSAGSFMFAFILSFELIFDEFVISVRIRGPEDSSFSTF